MKLISTCGSLIASYFIINFAWATYVINTNSQYKEEIKETMSLIYTSQLISFGNMKDLTGLLIKDVVDRLNDDERYEFDLEVQDIE